MTRPNPVNCWIAFMEIAFVLGLLIVTIILFSTEKISVDVVTIGLIIILTASGILSTEEAFAGFSSDFVILLASIFIITGAIQESGILDVIIGRFNDLENKNFSLVLLVIIIVTSFISAFMNNTTVTALLINPIMSIARKNNISASKLLMPVAFASIVGGNCTLIGTSTNVAVSGFITKAGMTPVGMFEILPIGLIITGVLIIYMVTIGKKLLPDRKTSKAVDEYGLKDYLSEIVVMPGSSLIGQKLFESDIAQRDFKILSLIRNKVKRNPSNELTIEENDLLLVEGKASELLKIKDTAGLEMKADIIDFEEIKDHRVKLAEVLIPSRSDLVNTTVREANFRQRFGVVVLAMHRAGQTLKEKIGNTKLHVGDVLLVQGSEERFEYLHSRNNLIVLEEYKPNLNAKQKGILTLAVFILGIVLGTLNIIPFSIAFLATAILSIFINKINSEKAYQLIDWRLLILIGGMSAFGAAMVKTGADNYLAEHIVSIFKPYGLQAILGGFIILTVLLTQPMSNAAAALVVLPIALETANVLDVNQRTFAIGIMMAASVSLITPFEPSCILVYSPGKYRFLDFIKVGGPLTLLLIIILIIFVPIYWPF